MPSVLTQPRMTQAPQQGAQVDWGNPLAAGLAALFNPAAPVNAATGAVVSVFGGSLARAVDPVIGLVQATAVNGSNWNTPGAYKGAGADITLWAQLVPNALGGTSRIFLGTSNSSNAGVSIGYSSGTSQFVFTKGAVADISSGFTPTIGQPYFLAASYRHATGLVTFYVRNLLTGAVFTSTATNTSSFVAGDGTFEYGGRQNATSNTLIGSIGMAGIAMRALSPTELAALADNPAQLFKAPPRRLWLAAAAGASGAISAALAGAGLTASGQATAQGPIASTLDGATLAAAGQASTAPSGSLASALAGASLAAAGGVTNVGSLVSTLVGASMTASGIVLNRGSFASTLDGAGLAASGQATPIPTGTLNSTLDGATLAAGGYVGIPPAGPNFFIRLPKNPRHVLPR